MTLHRGVRLRLSAAAGILMSCGAPGPSQVVPLDIYQPVSRELPATQMRSWWAGISYAISQAAPIPVLDSVALPPGARELRLSPSDGGMIWHPVPLLRLVEWDNRVAGELYLYWPRLRDSTGQEMIPYWVKNSQSSGGAAVVHPTSEGASVRPQTWFTPYVARRTAASRRGWMRRRCDWPGGADVHHTAKWATCRIPPRAGTSWRAVADSMDALRIWELPVGPEERRGSNATDQDGVMAELLIGQEYRRFRYYDLDALTGTDVTRVRGAAKLVAHLVPDRR